MIGLGRKPIFWLIYAALRIAQDLRLALRAIYFKARRYQCAKSGKIHALTTRERGLVKACRIDQGMAKDYFQVYGADKNGTELFSRKGRRYQVLSFFVNLLPCEVGLEACGGALHMDLWDM